ncbi:MAG: PQQ-like beta-propeller repeat protein [Gemmatimonadetes bacterium]|nr:PQQ-like beta-propeller repeat protein [Gemmatimonadota bacterium]
MTPPIVQHCCRPLLALLALALDPGELAAQAAARCAIPDGHCPLPGLWTFRGGPRRDGSGPAQIPDAPRIVWRYPERGSLCKRSRDLKGDRLWCGTGWTGQPTVVERPDRRLEVRIGAYDGAYHFLDGETGRPLRRRFRTGDLAKGSATSDPDGYPLLYGGSRDGKLRVFALEGDSVRVLWSLDARTSVPYRLWNDDWDGAPLVVDDHLILGGENSWFYVIRLERGFDDAGRVRVSPRIVFRAPGWDDELLSALGDRNVSIENSVAFAGGIAYFANSGGLVQGWDVRAVLAGDTVARRIFRFWTGDDTDASVILGPDGELYVATEYERGSPRSRAVGQIMRLEPTNPVDPIRWSVAVREPGWDGKAGVWATPALADGVLYVPTHDGQLLALDRDDGNILWRLRLPGPLWASPVVAGGVLLQGDCRGVLHAYTLDPARGPPTERWALEIGGCIESTPAVGREWIWVGTRAGTVVGLRGSVSAQPDPPIPPRNP